MALKYTKDNILGLLRKKAQELGRTPTRREVEEDRAMPSVKVYTRQFGSWNQTLIAAGLNINRVTKQLQKEMPEWLPKKVKEPSRRSKTRCFSDEELSAMLREKARELDRTPTVRDVARDHSIPSPSFYVKRFGSWNQAIEKAGLEFNNSGTRQKRCIYTDEDLIEMLREKARKIGRSPTFRSLLNDPEMECGPAVFAYHFRSWNEALKAAGLEINLPHKKRYTDDELIGFLQEKAKELGTRPRMADLDSDENMPYSGTFARRLGGWKEALRLAGLYDD